MVTAVTRTAPSLAMRLWPVAATLLLVGSLIAAVLWWRSTGPLVVEGERVAVAAPLAVGPRGRTTRPA